MPTHELQSLSIQCHLAPLWSYRPTAWHLRGDMFLPSPLIVRASSQGITPPPGWRSPGAPPLLWIGFTLKIKPLNLIFLGCTPHLVATIGSQTRDRSLPYSLLGPNPSQGIALPSLVKATGVPFSLWTGFAYRFNPRNLPLPGTHPTPHSCHSNTISAAGLLQQLFPAQADSHRRGSDLFPPDGKDWQVFFKSIHPSFWVAGLWLLMLSKA